MTLSSFSNSKKEKVKLLALPDQGKCVFEGSTVLQFSSPSHNNTFAHAAASKQTDVGPGLSRAMPDLHVSSLYVMSRQVTQQVRPYANNFNIRHTVHTQSVEDSIPVSQYVQSLTNIAHVVLTQWPTFCLWFGLFQARLQTHLKISIPFASLRF